MKLVFISDTHNKHNKLTIPECDILFCAGDMSFQGQKSEMENFAKWLHKQKATHIVLTIGNHERIFERAINGTDQDLSSKDWIMKHCPRAHLLIHEAVEIEGIKIFCSPWTPAFGHD